MTQGEKTANLLRNVHDQAVEMSKQLLFDKKHPLHLHIMMLYGSMLELALSMLC